MPSPTPVTKNFKKGKGSVGGKPVKINKDDIKKLSSIAGEVLGVNDVKDIINKAHKGDIGGALKSTAVAAAMFTPGGKILKVARLGTKARKLAKAEAAVGNTFGRARSKVSFKGKTAAARKVEQEKKIESAKKLDKSIKTQNIVKKNQKAAIKADAKKKVAMAKQPRIQGPAPKPGPLTARTKKMLDASKAAGEKVSPKELKELQRNLKARATNVERAVKKIQSNKPRPKPKAEPLSKEPRLNAETKQLLEKFQRSKVEPPTTKTSLGGMIGDARPLAKGQRLRAKRAEFEKREVEITKKDPEVLAEERKSRLRAKPQKTTLPLKPPEKPIVIKKLEPNQKKFTERGKAVEQDLEGTRDVQTVRGVEHPEGYVQKPSRDGATIESRTSQHPGSRGTNIKKVNEPTEEELLQRKVDTEVNKNWTTEAKYPAAESTVRKARVTPEERLATLKKQVRSRRAAEVAKKEKATKTKAKLTPAQKLKIKKEVKETVENSKKPNLIRIGFK